MRRRISFAWLFLPLSILIFLAFALFIERSGISYSISQRPSSFLEPFDVSLNDIEESNLTTKVSSLVLFHPSSVVKEKSFDTVSAVLDSMKIDYVNINIQNKPKIDFSLYENVIITFVELSFLDYTFEDLMNWVKSGGKLLFAIRPDNSDIIVNYQGELGIAFLESNYTISDGVEFLTELLPGTLGIDFGIDFFKHSSLPVNLKDSTIIHTISADNLSVPLIWETDLEKGKIIFINSDQFIDKSSRGIIGSAFSLLQDVIIYPVINASVFYIDDFPAPIPEGKNADIFRQFTRDIGSFYLNIWWPDMQELKEKYNLEYSSVIIESYNYKTLPPFEYTANQEDIFQYFGGSVLRDGGEIGLHGYNHIPLCEEKDKTNHILDYPTWDSQENMRSAVVELQKFSTFMFPGQPMTVYVPPSNILCDDAREWLTEVIPDLKIIASVYLPDKDVPAYVQEFEEAGDGIIEFPRITSGYNPDNFMMWTAANEIWLHYTASHFVHPDDVLDSYRNKGSTWLDMRKTLNEYLLWLFSSMPGVRNLIASEGAMAVQRFARLDPEYECSSSICELNLKGFYDEGWMMMHTKREPLSITNGNITKVSTDLYLIEAVDVNLHIEFEE